jgi:2-C-methyl-D-erythritol 4-phosphate cytidylyltransferase
VSEEVIQQALRHVQPGIGVVPAVAPHDSIRRIDDGKSQAVDRTMYRLVQTPQCFMLSDLRQAYALPYRVKFTDDASVVEASGREIMLIEGNAENIKITSPLDMQLAELLLKSDLG